MTHLADRSLNRRSSDRKPSLWSSFTDSMFGATNTLTDFDRRVDSYVSAEKYQHEKKLRKQKRLRSIDQDLNYAVTLPMFLGEIRVADSIVDVVYDTGSDWLAVPDSRCEECQGTKVDNSDQTVVDGSLSDRTYGSAHLIGSTYSGKVCLTSATSSCVTDFEYFSFVNQTGINNPVEGILGMSQNKQMMLSTEEVNLGPLFARELFLQDRVDQESFSFGFKGYSEDESSVLDFGRPQDYRTETGLEGTVYLGFNDDFFWSTSMQAVSFASNNSFAIDGAPYTIFDTGSSHMMVPPLLFEPMIEGIISGTGGAANYNIKQGQAFVDCSDMSLF